MIPNLAGGDRHRHLIGAVTEKLRFRERETAGVEARIVAEEARLKALWSSRLGHQMEALPPYDDVFRTVRRGLRQADFPDYRLLIGLKIRRTSVTVSG